MTLEEAGVTRIQSSRWQLEASLPEDRFTEWVSISNREGEELSAIRLQALARQFKASEAECPTDVRETGSEFGRQLQKLVASRRSFSCVFITPIWVGAEQISNDSRKEQTLLTMHEVAALPVPELASDRCHIHLWCPHDRFDDAKRLLRLWGCNYQGALICVCREGRFGSYWRESHSLVLLGVRGELKFRSNAEPSWILCAHKNGRPVFEALHRVIEMVSTGPFLHIFGESATAGWTCISSVPGEAG